MSFRLWVSKRINIRFFATIPDAALKAGDRIRTGDVQLGKLAFYR